MQLCGSCGNHNSDESIFCGHCGNRLNNRCPDCGFGNLMQQKFCGNCGKQLLTDAHIGQPAHTSPGMPARAPDAPVAAPPPMPASSAIPASIPASPPGPMATMPAVQPEAMGSPPAVSEGRPAVSGTPLHDEAWFDSLPDLPAYALASVEVANWDQLQLEAHDLAQLKQARQDCLRRLEERVLTAGGQINASKNGILFLSFKREASLEASLHKALSVAQDMLDSPWACEGLTLRLRIGLDIEQAADKSPLTSTLERSVGFPGTLTVSAQVAQVLGVGYPLEPIGPMPMGNRMMTFYRVLRPGSDLPKVEDWVGTPSPSLEIALGSMPTAPVPEPVSPPVDVAAALPAEPQPVMPPPEPEQAPPPVASAEAPDAVVESTAHAPDVTDTASEAEASASRPSGSGMPVPVHYDPPVLGLRKAGRTPNIKYQQAIDALTTELDGFLTQGQRARGKVVLLCGSDGLGKSSILNAVRARLEPEGHPVVWLMGHHYRCFRQQELPLYGWLEMMQSPLGLIPEGQPKADVQEALRQFVSGVYADSDPADPDAALDFLADWLSVRPPQPLTAQSRDALGRLETYFLDLLQRLARRSPVIVILKDLHDADPASLELWARLLERKLLDAPVCFIVTQSRDFYAHDRLFNALQRVEVRELVVADLDDQEAERFLDEGPLGGHLSSFPVPLTDLLLGQMRGQPIYLEEALRLLHLKDILAVDPHTHKFVMRQPQTEFPVDLLPTDLADVVRARLAFLSEQERYVLQLAAVLGEQFPVSVLMALGLPDVADESAQQTQLATVLNTLYDHGYLFPNAANTGRFRHGLIWQIVYQSMAADLRAQMHQLVSELLESDFNQGLTVHPMMIAYHAENGGLLNRALHYWNLAGVAAAQIGSLTAMNMAMFRALELLRESAPEPLHTSELALRTVESMGSMNLEEQPEAAVAWLDWVVYYRRLSGETLGLIEPLGLLAAACDHQGDFSRAVETLDEVLGLVDASTHPVETASILINKMEHLVTLGRIRQAHALMQETIQPLITRIRAERPDDEAFAEVALNARLVQAQVLLAQCDHAVFQVLEESLTEARRRGLDGLVIALQLIWGQALLRNGQYDSCNREADDLLRAIEALDNTDWFLAQWGLLAMMYHCEQEEWDSASQLVLRVTASAENARDYLTWAAAQTYAGAITAHLGKPKEARQLLEQAIGISSDHRFATTALLGWRLLAEFELSLGNHDVAAEIALRALDIANKPDIGHTDEVIQLTLTLARAQMAMGQVKVAGKQLEPLWPLVVKTRMQPLVAACAFEIGQLYKHLAQDAPADLSKKHLMRSVEFFLKAKGIWLELRHFPRVKRVDAVVPRL